MITEKSSKAWYIVQFLGYNSKNIIDISQRLGRRFGEDSVFCPIIKERKYNGKKRIFYEVDTPLFLSYVFLNTEFNPATETEIADYVAQRFQFLKYQLNDKWAYVSDDDIRRLKLEHEALIKGEIVLNTSLTINDIVRFKSGSFSGFTGKILAVFPSKNTAKVLTEVFKKETPVEIAISSLEKVIE